MDAAHKEFDRFVDGKVQRYDKKTGLSYYGAVIAVEMVPGGLIITSWVNRIRTTAPYPQNHDLHQHTVLLEDWSVSRIQNGELGLESQKESAIVTFSPPKEPLPLELEDARLATA